MRLPDGHSVILYSSDFMFKFAVLAGGAFNIIL